MQYAIEILKRHKAALQKEYVRIIKSNKSSLTSFENEAAIKAIDQRRNELNKAINQLQNTNQAAA